MEVTSQQKKTVHQSGCAEYLKSPTQHQTHPAQMHTQQTLHVVVYMGFNINTSC